MPLARVARPLRLLSILGVLASGGSAGAQLVIESTFNPSSAVDLCGVAVDSATGDVWVYDCLSADVQRYSSAGAFLASIPRPGESANDVDVEFSPVGFTLDATPVPPGTLLFINGETGPAEIYALDKSTGTVVETLNTAFGASHVVGGAFHPDRRTVFLVQDNVPAAADRNRIAEVDPTSGLVLSSFQIPSFPVSYGDVEVCASTGSLFVVSSIQTSIAEFTPAGTIVGTYPLPAGVVTLSGIGINDGTGEAWVSSTNGNVWRLSGLPCPACAPALTIAKAAGEVRIAWPGLAAGTPVDIVKGDLQTLRTTAGDFTVALDAVVPAADVCVGNDATAGLVVDDGSDPPSNAGRFYLGRCQGGTYDSLAPSQVASRDSEIKAAVGSCP